MDPRTTQLAKNLINYSVALKSGEKVFIDARNSNAFFLAEALIEAAYNVGGIPFYRLGDMRIQRSFLRRVSREQLEFEEKNFLEIIQYMQAYIGFLAVENMFEASDIPEEKAKLASEISRPSLDYRVEHTKWCVLRWPTFGMAQSAEMSTEAFEDFYYQVCLLDYAKMSKAMDVLVSLMNRTNKVHILGSNNTNLQFSIKEIPAIKCCGKRNIPDGEVYTAPVRNSVNGVVYFTTPTVYESRRFSGISLTFEDGKIVNATCEQGSQQTLNEILNRDEGAHYIGEFAIGVNPHINKAMMNTLFDEKIAGSFHFTPGRCYGKAPNGNYSQIHWDMVCIQTSEYGGGEIYFDGVLVRKDGRFVLPELEALNPENLI